MTRKETLAAMRGRRQVSVRLNMATFSFIVPLSMKSFSFLLLGLIIGCSTMFPTFAKNSEGRKEELKPATIALLKSRFPGFRITRVENEKERGEKMQHVRLKGDKEVEDVLVKLSRSGEILELDEDIEIEKVPEHVLAAFRKAFPDAKVTHSEKGTRMDISYRFNIENKGKKHEVSVSRSGKISGVARCE